MCNYNPLLIKKVENYRLTYVFVKSNVLNFSLGTLKMLINWIKDNMLKRTPELFVQDGTV